MAGKKKQVLPEVGATYAFRLDDGRYGVCRVLREANKNDLRLLGAPSVLVVTSAWIGEEMPDIADPGIKPILKYTRLNPKGEPVLEWQDVPPPRGFKLIGHLEPTADERKLKCDSTGFWENSPSMVFAQWQWIHDREAMLAAENSETQEEVAELEARNTAIELTRKSMTLEQLARRRFFPNWKDSPSKEAIRACRAVMKKTVQALGDLGTAATKAKRKKVLQDCIKQFNELNRTLNQFIETAERDDICMEFDLLVHACGLGEYENLADEWRDW